MHRELNSAVLVVFFTSSCHRLHDEPIFFLSKSSKRSVGWPPEYMERRKKARTNYPHIITKEEMHLKWLGAHSCASFDYIVARCATLLLQSKQWFFQMVSFLNHLINLISIFSIVFIAQCFSAYGRKWTL